MSKKLREKQIKLAGLFTKGFEERDWVNVGKEPLPIQVKYLNVDDLTTKYGETKQYFFELTDGREGRLLTKGKTFYSLITEHVGIGEVIELYKNGKGYWEFRPIEE